MARIWKKHLAEFEALDFWKVQLHLDFWKSADLYIKNTISSACETRTQRTEGIKPIKTPQNQASISQFNRNALNLYKHTISFFPHRFDHFGNTSGKITHRTRAPRSPIAPSQLAVSISPPNRRKCCARLWQNETWAAAGVGYPLVNKQFAIEKTSKIAIEIVDLPIKHGDFPSILLNVYQAG